MGLCSTRAILLLRVLIRPLLWFYFCSQSESGASGANKILTCYTTPTTPSVQQIDPFLCTHLILIGDCWLDEDARTIRFPSARVITELVALKNSNPDLKIIVTFSPANRLISQMVLNRTSMEFAASQVARYLTKYDLDGFDFDWEFPSWSKDSLPSDRFGFTVLLKIFRKKFNRHHFRAQSLTMNDDRRLLLFVTVAAPYDIVKTSYKVDVLNKVADYVQVMNYDFHVWSSHFPLTGFNAPLQAQSWEWGVSSTMNSKFSTEFWLSSGLNRSKLVFGIPTYGRGFDLVLPFWHTLYAPADDGFFVNYPMICKLEGFSYVWKKSSASPYIYRRRKWISYENERSVSEKTAYARENELAGVMVFALHMDDFTGSCRNEAYPLVKAIKKALSNSSSEA